MKELIALACIIYTFIYWGFVWGIVSLFIPPLFPLIDMIKYLFG